MVRSTSQNEQGFVFYTTENDIVHNDEDVQLEHKRVQFESDGIILFGHQFSESNMQDEDNPHYSDIH